MAKRSFNKCSCGHKYRVNEDDDVKSTSSVMDTSYVHLPNASCLLPTSLSTLHNHLGVGVGVGNTKFGSLNHPRVKKLSEDDNEHHGFLVRYRQLLAMEDVICNPFASHKVRMCRESIESLEWAVLEDTNRLDQEIQKFEEAADEEEEQAESWKRALATSSVYPHDECHSALTSYSYEDHDFDLQRHEEAFRREVEILRESISQQEEEILRLQGIQKEQVKLMSNLQEVQSAMHAERNALELEARAFDNEHDQQSRILVDVQSQVNWLSSPQIRLLFLMFDLEVDKKRGLRYPLINNLRLAYRPKGDVQWEEIQSSWSLSAQLLLSIVAVFQFKSTNWKIVPLSRCSKLIYNEDDCENKLSSTPTLLRSVVYNLGHPRTDGRLALMAWNTLLHAVIQHVTVLIHQAVEIELFESCFASVSTVPPFEISPNKIGDMILTRLEAKDDAACVGGLLRLGLDPRQRTKEREREKERRRENTD